MKAVQVAVLATPHGMSAVLRDMSFSQRGVLVAPRSVPAALRGMLALQDTHGNTRGAWGTLGEGGSVIYMKIFYGLELLKTYFRPKKKW